MRTTVFVILFLFGFCCNNLFAQKRLPNVVLNKLDGTVVTTNDISGNDTVVLSLWSTKCVPCKKELRAINKVYNEWHKDTGVKLYAVAIDNAKEKSTIRKMAKQGDWDFDVLLDDKKKLKKALGIRAVPLTLIIKNNKIVYQHIFNKK